MTNESYLSKLSSLNLNNISLYLKYGIISFPNLKIKKGKKEKLKKIKDINFNKNSYTDVLSCLSKLIDKQIKKSKKTNEKIILLLSSGVDSRLLYHIIFNLCKTNKYLDSFYTVTGNIKNYKNKYSEYEVLKKNFKQKIHNHKAVNIIYKNLEDEILESCNINQQPINGLPIITMKKLFKPDFLQVSEIVKAIDFLGAPEAKNITGQTIYFGGVR